MKGILTDTLHSLIKLNMFWPWDLTVWTALAPAIRTAPPASPQACSCEPLGTDYMVGMSRSPPGHSTHAPHAPLSCFCFIFLQSICPSLARLLTFGLSASVFAYYLSPSTKHGSPDSCPLCSLIAPP